MISTALIQSIEAMRPAVPARDYATSREFYEAIGFEATARGPTLTEMRLGPHRFLLQDFYVADYAGNFVMHMQVASADIWWAHVGTLDLEKRFAVRAPIAPRLESWGLRTMYLFDPSGVLWNIASRPAQ